MVNQVIDLHQYNVWKKCQLKSGVSSKVVNKKKKKNTTTPIKTQRSQGYI